MFKTLKPGSTGAPGMTGCLVARLLAAWLALQILFLGCLAASPSLHRAIHHDAANADHECAVTLFLHGQVSAETTVVVVAIVAAFFGVVWLLADEEIFAPAVYRFSSSRAPPALICR